MMVSAGAGPHSYVVKRVRILSKRSRLFEFCSFAPTDCHLFILHISILKKKKKLEKKITSMDSVYVCVCVPEQPFVHRDFLFSRNNFLFNFFSFLLLLLLLLHLFLYVYFNYA